MKNYKQLPKFQLKLIIEDIISLPFLSILFLITKGKENSIMQNHMLRAWMQDSIDPEYDDEGRPGRWVSECSWPSFKIFKMSPQALLK